MEGRQGGGGAVVWVGDGGCCTSSLCPRVAPGPCEVGDAEAGVSVQGHSSLV